jgi:hypothetical protein
MVKKLRLQNNERKFARRLMVGEYDLNLISIQMGKRWNRPWCKEPQWAAIAFYKALVDYERWVNSLLEKKLKKEN